MHGSDTVVSAQLRERAQRVGRLSVRRNGLFAPFRKYVVVPEVSAPSNLGVYNNNVSTVERALVERYLLCKEGDDFRPALPVRACAFRTPELASFRSDVLGHMPHLPVLSRAETVQLFRGSKRRVYEAADASLVLDDIREADARLTGFVKFEKQDLEKAPRMINPRDPRYNLELATFLKHTEHHFFNAINKAWGARTRATVIKGFNAQESAAILREKWNLFKDPVAVGLDATKFDMHVSMRALKYEHSFYTGLFPGRQKLRELLRWQLVNRGTAYCRDGSVKYQMSGTRSSGDMNTSLGNCILMCAMVHAWCKVQGVDAELANNGDDCVVFVERDSLERFMVGLDKFFRHLGFAMAVEEPVDTFEELEFCQTHPVLTANGWIMVRNHGACLKKDLMCLLAVPTDDVYRRWLGAVGECGLAASHGVPCLQAWYSMIRRNGTEPRQREMEHIFRNTSQLSRAFSGVDDVTPEARVSYYLAFGVYPDMQRALENMWSTTTIGSLGCGAPIHPGDLAYTSTPALLDQDNVL